MSNKQTKDKNIVITEKPTKQRKWWFKGLKKLMKGRYKEPVFVYLNNNNAGRRAVHGGLCAGHGEGL